MFDSRRNRIVDVKRPFEKYCNSENAKLSPIFLLHPRRKFLFAFVCLAFFWSPSAKSTLVSRETKRIPLDESLDHACFFFPSCSRVKSRRRFRRSKRFDSILVWILLQLPHFLSFLFVGKRRQNFSYHR